MDDPTWATAPEGWHDISVPLAEGITTFPDTPPLERALVASRDEGDPATVSALRMSTHTGTHVDAPVQFLDGGRGVAGSDLDALNGPVRVIEIPGMHRIGPEALGEHEPQPGERLLLRTRNSDTAWYRREFDPTYAHITAPAARLLAQRRIAAVGIDYLSIGGDESDTEETHQTLLGAGIVVLEGLYLGDVAPGRYELRCLPLLVVDGDGAPARALLRA